MEQDLARDILTVEEMASYLRLSRNSAYALVHRAGFPKLRLGRKIVIPRAALERWIERELAAGGYRA